MRKLWSGISTKIADTTRPVIDGLSQLFRSDPWRLPNPFSVVPILAEKTIKGASVIKYGEVLKPVFRTGGISKLGIAGTRPTRTNPIGYTISRKPIIIPTHIPLFR